MDMQRAYDIAVRHGFIEAIDVEGAPAALHAAMGAGADQEGARRR